MTENTVVSPDKFPFGVDFQYHILHMMLKNNGFLVKCLKYFSEEHFENSVIGWVFNFIESFYRDFNKPPEICTLKNEINKFSAEDRPKYERILDKIEFSNYSDEEYFLKEATGWLRSRKFIQLHTKVADLFNNKERESAYDLTCDAIQELKETSLMEDKVIDFSRFDEVIKRQSEASKYRIPLGIPILDRAMYGGLARQGLTTLLGVTNTGKTVTLINIAYHAILNGNNVLFCYHEGADDQFATRVMCRFARVPYYKFMNATDSFTEEEIYRIQTMKKLLAEKMVLKPFQKYGTTVDEVIGYARAKKAEFDFDILIDDYMQLLTVKRPDKEYRHNQAAVCKSLNQLAAELNIAVLTAAQGNRSALQATDIGSRLLFMTDISECFAACQTSECVITLTRSIEDANNNVVKFLLAKQREGKKGIAVECKTDIDKIIMYDQSLGMKDLRLTDAGGIVTEEESKQLTIVGDSNGTT